MTAAGVRPPAVAGMFYPLRPDELRMEIAALLRAARPPKIQGSIAALIAPHAGYAYSGPTAAAAYRLLEGRTFDTVVIVSPSHREYFDGVSVYDGDAYATPLGELRVDAALRDALIAGDAVVTASARGHRSEHAVEVHLPFLQSVLASAPKILPLVMGDQRAEFCRHLGRRLARILAGTNSLLVASTDLSHYHPYDAAELLDEAVIRTIERGDAERLLEDLATERAEACGGGPTAAVLVAARELGAGRVTILHHCNSGDVTGDRRSVVGYCSAAITR
jgi:AmmeMemoRadiSam system protein B